MKLKKALRILEIYDVIKGYANGVGNRRVNIESMRSSLKIHLNILGMQESNVECMKLTFKREHLDSMLFLTLLFSMSYPLNDVMINNACVHVGFIYMHFK